MFLLPFLFLYLLKFPSTNPKNKAVLCLIATFLGITSWITNLDQLDYPFETGNDWAILTNHYMLSYLFSDFVMMIMMNPRLDMIVHHLVCFMFIYTYSSIITSIEASAEIISIWPLFFTKQKSQYVRLLSICFRICLWFYVASFGFSVAEDKQWVCFAILVTILPLDLYWGFQIWKPVVSYQ